MTNRASTYLRGIGLAMAAVMAGQAHAESALTPAQVGERLEALFPNAELDSIARGPATGIYEIVSGANLYYYLPESDLLLFGEFYTADGRSVTADRMREHQLGGVDAEWHPAEAVTIRPGRVRLTAYLDVDCGHCRSAVHWLIDQKALPDAGLDVVFVSRTHEQAERAAHVLCSPPHLRGAALQHVFARGDGPWLDCEGSSETTQRHARIAADLGVTGTPMFVVGTEVVTGFNRDRLTSLVTGANP